jgi:hypothetical protein
VTGRCTGVYYTQSRDVTSALRNTVTQVAAPGFLYATRVRAALPDDDESFEGDEATRPQSRAIPQSSQAQADEDDDTVYGLYAAVVLADVRMACAWKRLLRPLLQHRHWQQGAYQVGLSPAIQIPAG